MLGPSFPCCSLQRAAGDLINEGDPEGIEISISQKCVVRKSEIKRLMQGGGSLELCRIARIGKAALIARIAPQMPRPRTVLMHPWFALPLMTRNRGQNMEAATKGKEQNSTCLPSV